MESVKELEKHNQKGLYRSDKPIEVQVEVFNSLEDILKTYSSSSTLFADISQGNWEGHQIAKQLLDQLSIARPKSIQPLIGVQRKGHYNDTINKLIDNESIGDINFIRSYELAKTILSNCHTQNKQKIVLLVPMDGIEWANEDKNLLDLIIQNLDTYNCELRLVSFYNYQLPQHWVEIKSNPRSSSKMQERVIIGITCKRDFPKNQFAQHDLKNGFTLLEYIGLKTPSVRLNSTETHDGLDSIVTFLLIKFKCEKVDTQYLINQASLHFSEGAYNVAKRILNYAADYCRNDLESAIVLSLLQNIRIALLEFEEASKVIIPELDIDHSFKANLYQSKAWGLVMCNQPQEAEPLFQLARDSFDKESYPRAYYYLLNISALNKLRLGETDKAFDLEKQIEKGLNQMSIPDWHVSYINSINQARLYKKERNLDESTRYYAKAFQINESLRVDSDQVYFNLCMAQLEELKENHFTSFIFWLRTCLHWLSMEIPEAIAPRVAQAIMKQRLSNKAETVDSISKQLLHEMRRASILNEIKIEEEINEPFSFHQLGKESLNPQKAIGRNGFGVFTTTEKSSDNYENSNYNSLAGLVSQVLKTLCPEIIDCKTVLVPNQFGREMPENGQELLLYCSIYQIEQLTFNGKSYFINENDQKITLKKAQVSLSSSISHLSKEGIQLVCHFKRYMPSFILSEKQSLVLESLTKNSNVENMLNINPDISTEFILDLQDKRVLTLSLD